MNKDRLQELAGIPREDRIIAEGSCGGNREEEEAKKCKCGCNPDTCKCSAGCKCGCNTKESQVNEGADPIVQMAEMFERLVMQEQPDEEDTHEVASDIMNALHEELRNRGLMA